MRLPRLYPILDTAATDRRGVENWGMVARAWLEGGAKILQIRHKGEWSRAALQQAEAVRDACAQASAVLVINDRADMAALLDAGLHVGQEDLAPTDCRALIGAGRMLGYSTHNDGQLDEASREPVDYVAFGPVFTTRSKDRPDPLVGLDALRRARALTSKPLVAIGGITRETAAHVLRAGADSVAVIADLLPDQLNESTLRERMDQWQKLTW